MKPTISPRLLSAAALLALTCFVHVKSGGVGVYAPLQPLPPTPELSLYLALLWHFVTAYFALGALGMAWAAFAPIARRQTAVAIGSLGLGMGLLFFVFGFAFLGEPWTAPQWSITLGIGILALWPPKDRQKMLGGA